MTNGEQGYSADYYKPGAIWQIHGDMWCAVQDSITSVEENRTFEQDGIELKLHGHWYQLVNHPDFKPILPPYKPYEQLAYYKLLCKLFDVPYVQGQAFIGYTNITAGLSVRILKNPIRISLHRTPFLIEQTDSIAGYGKPEQISLHQQHVNTIHNLIQKTQALYETAAVCIEDEQ